MAITLRHDAAAVVPPSNQTTRKYGQQLVLQQQQQKYAAQQAGYDRMFDAYKQQTQNQFQFGRDQFQNEMAFRKENRDNEFLLGRDKAQFDQQQQMQEAARQRAFMEDARKMSSGMIMDDIQNGNYDPATARQLQQNLVAESEALGNPQYDATQRAEALQKIRAARALLTANRLQKPPPPTPDEEIAALPEMNGTKYQKNKNGVWEPLQPSKQQQQQQELQQQEIEQMRPKSFEDYYNHADNKGQFKKDLDSTMAQLEGAWDPTSKEPKPTKQDALQKMQEDYDFQQKALGRPQYGEPTVAGPADPGATPAVPGTERSILEQGDPPQPDMSQLENPLPSEYTTGAPATTSPTQAAQNQWSDMASGRRTYDPPYREVAPPASQPEVPAQPSPTPQAGADKHPWLRQPGQLMQGTKASAGQAAPSPSIQPPPVAPDFGALASSATDDADRMVIGKLQGMYKTAKPEIQSAINSFLNPSSDEEAAQAMAFLRARGIDLQQLVAPDFRNFAETNAVM